MLAAAAMLAANLLLADDDTGGLWLPFAISLIRSRGFFNPPVVPPLLLLPMSRLLAAPEVGTGDGGIPYCNLASASGVRLPVAKRGCKNGQAPRAAESFSLSALLPNLGILGPPGLKLSGNPGLLLPDKSSGDSASLEGDLAGAEAADRLRTPANAAADAAAAAGECSSKVVSSCLRFRT